MRHFTADCEQRAKCAISWRSVDCFVLQFSMHGCSTWRLYLKKKKIYTQNADEDKWTSQFSRRNSTPATDCRTSSVSSVQHFLRCLQRLKVPFCVGGWHAKPLFFFFLLWHPRLPRKGRCHRDKVELAVFSGYFHIPCFHLKASVQSINQIVFV